MKRPPTPSALRENPPFAERQEIERRKRLVHLGRRDAPGVLDWPTLAGRLADELAELAARLADDPRATESDRERLSRARAVVADYRSVAREIEP